MATPTNNIYALMNEPTTPPRFGVVLAAGGGTNLRSNSVTGASSPSGPADFCTSEDVVTKLIKAAECPKVGELRPIDGVTIIHLSMLFNAEPTMADFQRGGVVKVILKGGNGKDRWTTTFIRDGKEKYVPAMIGDEDSTTKKYSSRAAFVLMVDSLLAGYRFYEYDKKTGQEKYLNDWDAIRSLIHEKLKQKYHYGKAKQQKKSKKKVEASSKDAK